MLPPKITPRVFYALARRRWRALLVPPALALMAGLTLWAVLPRLYRSEASLLVQAPEVSSAYVQPTIAAHSVEDRLQAAIQHILQRPRLLEIARRHDLYPALAGQGEERLVEQMRRNIAVELGEAPGLGEELRRQHDMVCFKLSFIHTDPRQAQRVAATLAGLLVEEGKRARIEHARQTTRFLERELERVRAQLEAREAAIRDYKEAHLGELPEQLQANLSALSRLQAALQTNQSALSAAEARQAALQQAAAEFAQAQMARNPGSVIPPPTLFAGPPEARLAALRESLPALEARYTANHPNVTKTRNEIKRLEAELARARPKRKAASAAPAANQDMGSQLAAVAAEIGRLRGEQAALQRRIAFHQERVEATPQREQELAALSREYESARASHEALLKRRAEAEMAEKLEGKEPAAQFRIIDAANLPERPFKPSLPRILAVALLVGVSGGAALAVGRESADRTFRSVDDLEAYLGLGVLAALPLLKSPEQEAAQRRKRRLVAAATLAAALLWAGLIAYVRSGHQAA